MKQKTFNKLYITIFAVLLVLFILSLTVGITGAWFGSTREISGKVNLTPGIKVDFGYNMPSPTLEFDETTQEFWLLKFDVENYADLSDTSTTSKLEVSDIRPGDKIAVVNPILTSLTTDNFYLRAKVIYKNKTTNEILTVDKMNEIFRTTTPLTFGYDWLIDENGEWSYCVGNITEWSTGKANADDLKLIEEYMQVSFFTTATQNAIKFVPLDIPESSIEHFSISGVSIILQLQAIEAEYVNEQFFS